MFFLVISQAKWHNRIINGTLKPMHNQLAHGTKHF